MLWGFYVLVVFGSFMASYGVTRISCPLQGCEGCRSGNGKGFTKKYFIDHLGTRHFKTDSLKDSYKARVASDFSLFSAFDQALHQAGIWLCGECFCTHTFTMVSLGSLARYKDVKDVGVGMALHQAGIWLCGDCFCTHTFSKNCKHAHGVVIPAPSFDEVAIYGIPMSRRPVLNVGDSDADESVGTLAIDEAVVEGANFLMPSLSVESACFDINLLSRVFSKKLHTVKCIPPRLRLGFAKLFRNALDNVLACPGDLSVWVQLIILPSCVLSTFVPTNRAQRRTGERERCQFECISQAILRWRDPVDRLGLVLDRLVEVTPAVSKVKKTKD
ncbi:hypothetical protein CTI12_AA360760 [Artemisia annua]|uniref:Uncharacterized protein n=1 Tax=Artemisia annua TaxID=35608 RepID=A0A2U1MMP8_ARTAN|nr:hypothetical protein CTI12_AA360760 [Artemisia annua]